MTHYPLHKQSPGQAFAEKAAELAERSRERLEAEKEIEQASPEAQKHYRIIDNTEEEFDGGPKYPPIYVPELSYGGFICATVANAPDSMSIHPVLLSASGDHYAEQAGRDLCSMMFPAPAYTRRQMFLRRRPVGEEATDVVVFWQEQS